MKTSLFVQNVVADLRAEMASTIEAMCGDLRTMLTREGGVIDSAAFPLTTSIYLEVGTYNRNYFRKGNSDTYLNGAQTRWFLASVGRQMRNLELQSQDAEADMALIARKGVENALAVRNTENRADAWLDAYAAALGGESEELKAAKAEHNRLKGTLKVLCGQPPSTTRDKMVSQNEALLSKASEEVSRLEKSEEKRRGQIPASLQAELRAILASVPKGCYVTDNSPLWELRSLADELLPTEPVQEEVVVAQSTSTVTAEVMVTETEVPATATRKGTRQGPAASKGRKPNQNRKVPAETASAATPAV